jgi:hypothetical protein
MNNEAQGPLPRVPFDVLELQGIERVLWAISTISASFRLLPRTYTGPRDAQRDESRQTVRKRAQTKEGKAL